MLRLVCQRIVLGSANKLQSVRSQISEAQKIASGSGSAQDIAEANIELEVRDAATSRFNRADTFTPGARELAVRSEVGCVCKIQYKRIELNLLCENTGKVQCCEIPRTPSMYILTGQRLGTEVEVIVLCCHQPP